MSIDLNIYTKNLSANLLPPIIQRFKEFDMDIEFHPTFCFNEWDDGFLPIKLKVFNSEIPAYDNFEGDILTGFDVCYLRNYNYEKELSELKAINQSKPYLFARLLGKPKEVTTPGNFIANATLDEKLKACTKEIIVSWKSTNVSELRVARFFAAFLTELTDGVIYDPQEGGYYDANKALVVFPKKIQEREKNTAQKHFILDKFEEWL